MCQCYKTFFITEAQNKLARVFVPKVLLGQNVIFVCRSEPTRVGGLDTQHSNLNQTINIIE